MLEGNCLDVICGRKPSLANCLSLFQFFDMRLLFLLTALCADIR